MVANFKEHSCEVYADSTLESCTGCPFWLVDTESLETGMCFITGIEVPLDEKPDTERMKECPIKIRSVSCISSYFSSKNWEEQNG